MDIFHPAMPPLNRFRINISTMDPRLERHINRKRTVSVIGNGDEQPDSPTYQLAVKVGTALVDAGYRVVTGGGHGIMEAASKGASQSKNWQDGDVIAILPGDDPYYANPYADIVVSTGIGFSRNYIIAHSDAVIAVGGGSGTLSEIGHSWTLKRLIICMRGTGWSDRLGGKPLDHRTRFRHIPDDQIFSATTPTDAVDILDKYMPLYIRHEDLNLNEKWEKDVRSNYSGR